MSHRGDVVDEVIAGAVEIAERFGALAEHLERMEHRLHGLDEQVAFASRALAFRFQDTAES